MATPAFQFVSVWKIPSDLITVWDHIARVTQYPTWWPSVGQVELVHGPELPVSLGAKARYIVQAPLYALTYETEVIEVVTGSYVLAKSTGDLVGTGRWVFKENNDNIEATFYWQVDLNRPVLHRLSRLPGARAVMSYFHERVMKQGERGLQQLVQTKANIKEAPVGA